MGTAFGSRVAMNETHLLISDPGAATLCGDPFVCATGAVHAYERRDGRWHRFQMLVPPDATAENTFAVLGLDGDRLLVGDTGAGLAEPDAGGVFVYDFDGNEWVETGRIAPPEPGFGFAFGGVVATEGDLAMVFDLREVVSVFQEASDGWAYRQRLTRPDGAGTRTRFGLAMAIEDDWAFIGAREDDAIARFGGAVYVYRREIDGTLTYHQKLIPFDAADGTGFGTALAADGGRLAVGGYAADRETNAQGAVYVYELEGDQWVFRGDMTHRDPTGVDRLGETLDLHGDLIVAGAPGQRTLRAIGVAYAFARDSDGVWSQRARLLPETPSAPFGAAVATNGRSAVVGARDEFVEGVKVGAAHVFDLACEICRPDLDADGSLTVFDFLTYLNLFQDGDALADFDGDGELTIFDFLAFQDAFAAGC
ncbi:MAG: GC-type dockerin domain-anchored protein [Phycisphaerales bacterium]